MAFQARKVSGAFEKRAPGSYLLDINDKQAMLFLKYLNDEKRNEFACSVLNLIILLSWKGLN